MLVEMSALEIIKSMFMLGIAIGGIGAGGIALYFGSKKNRMVGSILIVVGAVFLALCVYMYATPFALINPFWGLIASIILVVIGGGIGIAIVGGVFLLTVLR